MATRTLRSAQSNGVFESIYGIVDSKMMFVEYQTQKLLNWLSPVHSIGDNVSDTESPVFGAQRATIVENDLMFERIENLSRSIYWLEQFKLSLRPDNALEIMDLLENDKFMTVSEPEMEEILEGTKDEGLCTKDEVRRTMYELQD